MNTALRYAPSQHVFTEGCGPEQGAPASYLVSAAMLNHCGDGCDSTMLISLLMDGVAKGINSMRKTCYL